MKLFEQYKHLKREIYILFYGRIVTNMGALIWPLLTLILSNKLGMNAKQIAFLVLIMSILQFPSIMIGGRLADKFNKKYVIVVCDMVTVISYLICGLIPLSYYSIGLFYVASIFATLEYPSYDALIADLSESDDREKAYSLQYLGANLGLVLAPTIGGLLFENHLNLAFLLNNISTFSSTVLIMFFIKELEIKKTQVNAYEAKAEGESTLSIILRAKSVLLYIIVGALGGLVYSEFNYLLPLNLENLYGAKGATIFGLLTSVNAFVVIVGTPLITTYFKKVYDIQKVLIGEILLTFGLVCYAIIQKNIPFYFILMIVFTIGEIFSTLGKQPYMTRRIPSTHWGRVNSTISVVTSIFVAIAQQFIGFVIDTYNYEVAWMVVGIVGLLAITVGFLNVFWDRKQFPLLYKNENSLD